MPALDLISVHVLMWTCLSRIRIVVFRSLTTRGHLLTTWTLALHTVAHQLRLQFPSSIALTTHTQLIALITQLSPITRSLKSYYTHYIRPTQILFRSLSIVLAFSTVLVLAALPSHSVKSLVLFCVYLS